MGAVEQSWIAEACEQLGVTHVSSVRGGAQKAVSIVRRDSDDLILKVIALSGSSSTALHRAQREVDLLRALDNAHVVRVVSELVEVGEPPHAAAWLEECLDGRDLTAALTEVWAWDQAGAMAVDVSHGLAVAHERRVVHRDLSPNNVRQLGTGRYKVMDFGFARHLGLSGLTLGGQPGTPGFLSPEHLFSYSGAPTPASDVFVVGILMFFALTRQLPVPYDDDDARYVQRLATGDFEDIRAARPDLPADVHALIRRCLHPQPARRYRNGGQLADALEGLLS